MKKIVLVLLIFTSFKSISQNEACIFSDGYYQFSVQMIIENIALDFDKSDFILHLETHSNISSSQINHLENNLIEVYRTHPNSNSEPEANFLRISSTDASLDSFLSAFNESIQSAEMLCNCDYSDGFYYNYVRLITNQIPADEFNKTDFIAHLVANSTVSSSDLDFLNNSIEAVSLGFPSSQTESLQKTLSIVSNHDLMLPYLYNFPESIDLVEFLCGEAQLSVTNVDLENTIQIVPNPMTENSNIIISDNSLLKELIVFDINGKMLVKRSIDNAKRIEISSLNLDSGLYFFKFNADTGSIIKKVIFK